MPSARQSTVTPCKHIMARALRVIPPMGHGKSQSPISSGRHVPVASPVAIAVAMTGSTCGACRWGLGLWGPCGVRSGATASACERSSVVMLAAAHAVSACGVDGNGARFGASRPATMKQEPCPHVTGLQPRTRVRGREGVGRMRVGVKPSCPSIRRGSIPRDSTKGD